MLSAMTMQLDAASDRGIVGDNITNDSTPTFEFDLTEAGILEIDYDGDGNVDHTQSVGTAGIIELTSGELADGSYTAQATFTPTSTGVAENDSLSFTIDTLAPILTSGDMFELNGVTQRSVNFSEDLLGSSVTTSSVSVVGATTASVTSVSGSGANYTINFDALTTGGDHELQFSSSVTDIAGNSVVNGIGGDANDEFFVVASDAITVTTDTTVESTSTIYDGKDVVVDGAKLTITGHHELNSFWVINSGVVTHANGDLLGPHLTIAEDVGIESGSTLSMNSRGYRGVYADKGQGPGRGNNSAAGGDGGGHGGNGTSIYGSGGGEYGDSLMPTTLGSSGGGSYHFQPGRGGHGGGLLRLEVADTLFLEGTITANGGNFASGRAGGGSGGSIWVTTSVLTGAGTFHANGGNGRYEHGGGGGGGRIAVYSANDDNYTGQSGSTVARGTGEWLGTAGTLNFLLYNVAPTAVSDSVTISEDSFVDIDVIANDTDPENDDLEVISTTTPLFGAVIVNPDETIRYTPNANFFGTDTFDYTIRDANNNESTATVTVTVDSVNDSPVANDDWAAVKYDGQVTINVLANDTDVEDGTPTIKSIIQGSFGTAVDNGDGTITYTSNPGYDVEDTFSYVVEDASGATSTAMVHIDEILIMISLDPSSETGVPDDQLINIRNPTFGIEVGDGGLLEVDFDGDGQVDHSETVGSASIVLATAQSLSDGAYTITAQIGAETATFDYTIDATPPVLEVPHTIVPNGTTQHTFQLSEPLWTENLTPSSATLLAPDGITEVALTSLSLTGTTLTIQFPALTTAGEYTLTFDETVVDLAGNRLVDLTGQLATIRIQVAATTALWISSPLTVGTSETTLNGKDVVVDGTTLTATGAHTPKSLWVINGGKVTHVGDVTSGLQLAIAEDVLVDATSTINVNHKGYDTNGPGVPAIDYGDVGSGGSYGGLGGNAGGALGPTYGSAEQPAHLGSAGAQSNSDSTDTRGGYGGGRVKLDIAGSLQLDGKITANGEDGPSTPWASTSGGGGAGGSIWIVADTIAGTGTAHADGGTAVYGSGGGGGGRIAIYYYNNTQYTGSANSTVSSGGSGSQDGTLIHRRINRSPDVVDDPTTVYMDNIKVIDVLANDSDQDNDAITIESFTQPLHGTLIHQGSGVFTYDPDPGYVGADSFTYTVTEGFTYVSEGNADYTATVALTVIDGNPTAPIIVGSNSGAINENSSGDTVVALNTPLSVNDPDPLGTMTWSITSSEFQVDAATGVVSLKSGITLDFENQSVYTAEVTVSDGRHTSQVHNLVIDINDMNDHIPTISGPTSLSLAEDVSIGTVVIDTLAVSDVDTVGTMTWMLDTTYFDIDASTGEISLVTALDRELVGQHVLSVSVSDGVNTSAIHQITIDVTDVNDSTPEISGSTAGLISESAPSGGLVYLETALTATDADEISTLQWSWDSTVFDFDAQTGAITLANGQTLSRDIQQFHTINFIVSDGLHESTPHQVVIEVLPENLVVNGSFEDNPLAAGTWDIFYPEDSLAGWSIFSGPALEIHHNAFKTASDGTHYVELDGDENGPTNRFNEDPNDRREPISHQERGSAGIQQTIQVIPGRLYMLQFDFAGRTGTGVDENRVLAKIIGATESIEIIHERDGSQDWLRDTMLFEAAGSEITISFEDIGIDNTVGTFLDNVRVYEYQVAVRGDSTVNEGSPYVLELSASEGLRESLSGWTVDWGDGNIDTLSGSATQATHTYLDGEATYQIVATATDDLGAPFPAIPIDVLVENVSPVIAITGNSQVTLGETLQIDFTIGADPGQDTITQVEIDWGDGAVESLPLGTSTTTHTFNDAPTANYAIVVRVTDEDGTHSSTPHVVTLKDHIELNEGDDYEVVHTEALMIPENPSALSFTLRSASFDVTSEGINDAFEVALLDENGRPLVGTVIQGQDAFFNWTEGESPLLGPAVTYDSQTGEVTVDVSHLAVGTAANLVFRLVNNDADTNSKAVIAPQPSFVTSSLPDPETRVTSRRVSGDAVNGQGLVDVTTSIAFEYQTTSLSSENNVLLVVGQLSNRGGYAIRGPVLVVFDQFSDPGVHLSNADGVLADGRAYLNVSNELFGPTGFEFTPNSVSDDFDIRFHNPGGQQFRYRVTVLADLNDAPVFESTPESEIVAGLDYSYQAVATDLDGDALTYSILVGPDGANVDPNSGLLTWTTSVPEVGHHTYVVRATDPSGSFVDQTFNLNVVTGVPNRPPVITSSPLTQAHVREEYSYQMTASDIDGDSLTYSLTHGPSGAVINDPAIGLVNWTPAETELGQTVTFVVQVSDSSGGIAEQTFEVVVDGEANHTPVIVSKPYHTAWRDRLFEYEIEALDADGDEVTITFGSGYTPIDDMRIEEVDGKILFRWTPTGNTTQTIEFFATDEHGAQTTQTATITSKPIPYFRGTISGTIWNDVDGDKIFDAEEGVLGNVTVYWDQNNNAQFDADERSTITNSNGYYIFHDVPFYDTYIVRQVVPSGYIQTYPDEAAAVPGVDEYGWWRVNTGDSTNHIEFNEYSVGTTIRDQYLTVGDGVTFGGHFVGQHVAAQGEVPGTDNYYTGLILGDPTGEVRIDSFSPSVFTTYDSEAPLDPVLSGNPQFNGPISFVFESPQTGVRFSIGELDSSTSIQIRLYDEAGNVILQDTGDLGYQTYGYVASDGLTPVIKAVQISYVGEEPYGFGIDEVYFTSDPIPAKFGAHVFYVHAGSPNPVGNFGDQRDASIPEEALKIVSRPVRTSLVNQPYRYQVKAYSETQLPVTFELVDAPAGMIIEPNRGMIRWTPDELDEGTYNVSVKAVDSTGRVDIQEFELTTLGSNDAPEFTSKPRHSASVGREWSYQLEAFDPNGDPLSYVMDYHPSGATFDAATRTVRWTPTKEGFDKFRFQVSDPRGGTDQQNVPVWVFDNAPPEIVSYPSEIAFIDETWTYTVVTEDLENEPNLTVSLDAKSSARGMSLVGDTITWTPTQLHDANVTVTATDYVGLTTTQTFVLSVQPQVVASLPPVFTSQPSGPAFVGSEWTYTMQAVDPEAENISYSLISGPAGLALSGGNQLSWIPSVASAGESIVVRSTDAHGHYSEQSFELVVLSGIPGVGEAAYFTTTPTLNHPLDELYSLTLTAIDPDGGNVTFSLDEGPVGMTLENGTLLWRPQSTGTYSIQVTATDDQGQSAQLSYTLSIEAPIQVNQAPTFVKLPAGPASKDQFFSHRVTANDSHGQDLTYELDKDFYDPTLTIDANTGLLTWTPADSGLFDFAITVTDSLGATTSEVVSLVVLDNASPQITSQPPATVELGQTVSYQVTVSDPNPGDTPSFTLSDAPPGMQIDGQTGLITWTATTTGVYEVAIAVSDSQGASSSQEFTLQVVDPANNNAPIITSQPRTVIQAGFAYYHQAEAVDVDGDQVSFTLVTAPAGMTIDHDGLIGWYPTGDDVSTTPHEFRLRADDGRGGVTEKSFWIKVQQEFVNSAPSITSTPPQASVVGQEFQYDVKANDPDRDLLVFTLVNGPAGAGIDESSGVLSWTPELMDLGKQAFTVAVVDPFGEIDLQSFAVDVQRTGRPPAITSVPPTQAVLNLEYEYQVVGSDADSTNLTYELDAASLTRGMTINAQAGLISWTPTSLGTVRVQVTATDSDGLSASQIYDLQTFSAHNTAPYINSVPQLYAEADTLYTYAIDAFDPQGNPLSYQLNAPDPILTNMNFDANTGVLTWTPNAALIGTEVAFSLSAIDSFGLKATQTFRLPVNSTNAVPTIDSEPILSVSRGAVYAYDVVATDGDNEPLTYSLDQSSVNRGMSIDSYGRIRWNTDDIALGSYDVTVTATDIRNAFDTQIYSLDVVIDEVLPTVSVRFSNDPARIDSDIVAQVHAFDDVEVVSSTLTLTGKTVSGNTTNLNQAMPLDVSGQARFRVDEVGTYEFTATATDAAGNTETIIVTLDTFDPADAAAPTAGFANISDGQILDRPTDIKINLDDDQPSNLSYTLDLISGDTGHTTLLASGFGPLTAHTVARLDTTNIANGDYFLRITATDASGKQTIVDTWVTIDAPLKLGNFTLSFTDLEVPVAGIPVTITRTYDSQHAASSGDFGQGWRLDIATTDIDIQYTTGQDTPGFSGYPPFKDGTRIVVILPDGTQEGFTFYTEWHMSGLDAHGIPAEYIIGPRLYKPAFIPDAGVSSTLEVDDVLIVKAGDEYIVTDGGAGYYEYNPLDPKIGSGKFRLTLRNGTLLSIDGSTGDLESITDTIGNTLTITENGIFHESGRGVKFERDHRGRIVALEDPAGNKLRYRYDTQGNLIATTDRVGSTTTFKYEEPTRAHYLTEIIDPSGRPAARTDYADDGRIAQVIDADGQTIVYNYNTENLVQQVTNQLGHTSTLELDERGNVIREVSPSGLTTLRTYDGRDNPLTETLVVGQIDSASNGETDDLTTRYTYDADDNRASVTDPRGHRTRTTYNKYGQPLTVIDRLGNVTRNNFDEYGRLLSTVDPLGNTTTFTYDDRSNLHQIFDADGHRLVENSYNQFQDVARTNPTSGRDTFFEYDLNGDQVKTFYLHVSGQTQIYIEDHTTYDAARRVIGTSRVRREIGGPTQTLWTTSTTYDPNGQVATTTDRHGLVTAYTYDLRGQLIETRQESRDAAGNTVWLISRTAYDAAGNVIATTGTHEATTALADISGSLTTYDIDGRVTQSTNARGIQIDLLDINGLVTSNPAQAVRSVLTSSGTALSISYTVYDSLGRVSESYTDREPESTQDIQLRSRYTYNSFGETTQTQSQSIDQHGNVVWLSSRTVYDDFGRVALTTDQYLSDEFGEPSTADPIYASETNYDSRGRAAQSIRREGVTVSNTNGETFVTNSGSILWQTDSVYDSEGKLITSVAADGQTTQFEYDYLGRTTAVINHGVTIDGQLMHHRTETVYDAQGRVQLSRTNVKQLADGTTDLTAAQETSYEYDEFGNVVKTTFADGTTATTTYDDLGRKVSETNQMGLSRNFIYDAVGQLVAVELPSVENPDSGLLERPRYEYEFDQNGNQTGLTDPLDRETTFTFNELGQQLTRSLPDGSTETITYDARGRQLTHTSFEGVITEFTYDSVTGDLTEERFFADATSYSSGTADETKRYTYDYYGALVTTEFLNAASTVTRTETNTYDSRGRMISVTNPEGTLSYEYDDFGRLTKTSIGNATAPERTISYTYDDLGRLKTAVEDQSPAVTSDPLLTTTYDYDLLGNMAQTVGPNGVISRYEYDDLNRLDLLTHYQSDDDNSDLTDNAVIARYDYTVQSDGRRTRVIEGHDVDGDGNIQANEQSQIDWTYDDAGRLVTEVIDHYDNSHDQTLNFTYDLTGNRVERTKDLANDGTINEITSYTHDDNDRLLTEATSGKTTTYAYTGTRQTGKTVNDSGANEVTTVTYGYDLRGRMASVNTVLVDGGGLVGDETVTYDYDSSGLRVGKTVTNLTTTTTETKYLFDTQNHTGYQQVVREEVTVDGALEKTIEYTFGHDEISQTIARFNPDGSVNTKTDHFFIHDGHGSVRVLLDAVAAIIELYNFDAYGNPFGFDPKTALTSIGYSGESFDASINQQYLRARWYDAATGRFNRLDPFFGNHSDPQSFHKYLYTHADPVNLHDPTGLFAAVGTLGAISAVNSLRAIDAGVSNDVLQSVSDQLGYSYTFASNALELVLVSAIKAAAPIIIDKLSSLLHAYPHLQEIIAGSAIGVVLGLAGTAAAKQARLAFKASKTIRAQERLFDTVSLAMKSSNPNAYEGFVRIQKGNKTFLMTPGPLLPRPIKGARTGQLVPHGIGAVTGVTKSSRAKLRENMLNRMQLGGDLNTSAARSIDQLEAHHLIPVEVAKNHPLFKKFGMHVSDASNGIFLSKGIHNGSHDSYANAIWRTLDDFHRANPNATGKQIQDKIFEIQVMASDALSRGRAKLTGESATLEKTWYDVINKF